MPISIPDKFMVSRQTQFTMTLSMSCFLDNIKRRAVLPNEKHAFFVGWRAGMLHYRTGQWAAHYSGLQKRAGQRIVLFCSPPRPLLQPALLCSMPACPSVSCAARRKFTFFIWTHGPPNRPARWPSN